MEKVLYRDDEAGMYVPAYGLRNRAAPTTKILLTSTRMEIDVPTASVIPFQQNLVGQALNPAHPDGEVAAAAKRARHQHGPGHRPRQAMAAAALAAAVVQAANQGQQAQENANPQLPAPAVLDPPPPAAVQGQDADPTDILLGRVDSVRIPTMNAHSLQPSSDALL